MKSIPTPSIFKTLVLTTLALIAFAANSVLCRMALGEQHIDAASFSVIRLLSGAVILMLILSFKNGARPAARGNWLSASMLFLYAITFSYAYLSLHTGTGALILFASVQITMILFSLFSGNRLHTSEWLGVAIAFAGFVYLVLPGVSAPSLQGFVLMTIAGIAWGVYSLRGRGSQSPLADTAFNFLRTLPFAGLVLVFTLSVDDAGSGGAVVGAGHCRARWCGFGQRTHHLAPGHVVGTDSGRNPAGSAGAALPGQVLTARIGLEPIVRHSRHPERRQCLPGKINA